MKKVLLSVCIIAIISLSACRENGVEYDTTIPVVQPNSATALPVDTNPSTVNAATAVQQTLPSVPVQTNFKKGTAALNPEHGQPNHRCDIAVSAPLNSPSQQVQQTAPATQALPVQAKPVINTSGTVTINPPHGEPGHDCAIPVGQPLKS